MATLKERAIQIRDANKIGENTAERVGGLFVDMVEASDLLSLQVDEQHAANAAAISENATQITRTNSRVQSISNDIQDLQSKVLTLQTNIVNLGDFSTVVELETALMNAPASNTVAIYFGRGGDKGAICLTVCAAVGQYGGWTQLILLDTVLRVRKVYKDADGNRTADAWSTI